MHCNCNLVSLEGRGAPLSLEPEEGAGGNGVWHASASWDPETCSLPSPDTVSATTASITPIDAQLHVTCHMAERAPVRFSTFVRLHVKHVAR